MKINLAIGDIGLALSIELVTTITIILIGVIMTVYLLVLKSNGWIGKTTNYRCPNPACKKIFQNPMKVTDLAGTNQSQFACPECGFELNSSFFNKKFTFEKQSNLNEKTSIQNNYVIINKMDNQTATSSKSPFVNIPKNPSEFKPQLVNSTRRTQEIKYPTNTIINSAKNTPETRHSVVNNMKNNPETKNPLITTVKTTPEAKPIAITNTRSTSAPVLEPKDSSNNSEKTNKSFFKKHSPAFQVKPPGCPFHLGYLYALQKGTPIPYKCYACVRLIDCYKPLEERKE